jgi:hypothetical protein
MSPHVHQFVRAKLDEMDAITRAEFHHEERIGAVVDRARDERAAASAERRHAEWFVRGGRSDAGDAEIVPEASAASSISGDRSQAIAPSAGQSGARSPRTHPADLENIVAAARRMAARAEGEIAVSCFRAACSLLEREGSRTWAIDLGHELLRCPIASDQRAIISTLLDAISNRMRHRA